MINTIYYVSVVRILINNKEIPYKHNESIHQ